MYGLLLFYILTSSSWYSEDMKTNITHTAWKVSKYGIILVRIFLYSDWIQENKDQNNSVFGHFHAVPVILISEKDKPRIVNTLFKVKLPTLVGQSAALLKRNFPYAIFFREILE